MLIYVGPLWISLEMKIKTNKYCSGAILGQENPLGDIGHFNLGIMGYNNWNNNWGNSWNNWGNGKGKGRGKNWFGNQNSNRAAPYFGGAQSVTSQLGNALGEMASMAEMCRVGQILNQSNVLSPGANGTGQIQSPGQSSNVPGAGSNPQDGQTLVTSLQNVLDTALQKAQTNGTSSQGAAPGANAASVRGADPAGGTAVPMASMDQATFNDMLSRNEQFTCMQGDVTSLRSSVTSLNRDVQKQFQSIQTSQTSGFSEMRAMLSRIVGGGSTNDAAGSAHTRVPAPSANSGAPCRPDGAPVLPTASPDARVHLDSRGHITTEQHDKIVEILGIQDSSAQARKARPDGLCAVSDWWSEFKKAKKLAGWQSLLKDMGIAEDAADEIDGLNDVLPFLIDALDTPTDWAPGFYLSGA